MCSCWKLYYCRKTGKVSLSRGVVWVLSWHGGIQFSYQAYGFTMANEMIRSGIKWSAMSLLEIGIVDTVCEKGHALKIALEKIEARETKVPCQFERNTSQVPKNDLLAIVNRWLLETLSLGDDNIQTMKRIIMLQKNCTSM